METSEQIDLQQQHTDLLYEWNKKYTQSEYIIVELPHLKGTRSFSQLSNPFVSLLPWFRSYPLTITKNRRNESKNEWYLIEFRQIDYSNVERLKMIEYTNVVTLSLWRRNSLSGWRIQAGNGSNEYHPERAVAARARLIPESRLTNETPSYTGPEG